MKCVWLDFETYYDNAYSLKKIPIEEYVRDKRFQTHLLGYAVNNGHVKMRAGELEIQEALRHLGLHEPDTMTFAHNAKFDMFVLRERYGIDVRNPVCTVAMSRWVGASRLVSGSLAALCEFFGVGQKGTFIQNMSGRRIEDLTQEELEAYKTYCSGDVEQLRAVALKMLPHVSAEALAFIIMTTRMYTDPAFELDSKMLEDYQAELARKRKQAQHDLARLFSFSSVTEFLQAIRSKQTFCDMLERLGETVPLKVSKKKTETRRKYLKEQLTFVTNEDAAMQIRQQLAEKKYVVMEPALAKNDLGFQALLESDNPDIVTLASARAQNNTSIAQSRAETFSAIAKRGRFPVPLEAYRAWTGRYTSGTGDEAKSDGTNPQNLNKRTGDKTLRRCVQAPEGYVIVAGDSSQIEARTGAWCAGAYNLLEDFVSGADPYSRLASQLYATPYEDIYYYTKGAGASLASVSAEVKARYKHYRDVGKEGVLSAQYGIGAATIGLRLKQKGIRLTSIVDGLEDRSDAAHDRESKKLIDAYRGFYRAIPRFWRVCDQVLDALLHGGSGYFGGPEDRTFYYDGRHNVFGRQVPGIMLPDGFWILYPELRIEYDVEREKDGYCYTQRDKGKYISKPLWGGIVFNNINQGLAFAIMRWQALQINRQIAVRVNIHDSWGGLVPVRQADWGKKIFTHWMRQVPTWAEGIPVDCDVNVGRDFTIV